MYNNEYNRGISQRLMNNNANYAMHHEVTPLMRFHRQEGGNVTFNSASKKDAQDGTYYDMVANPEMTGLNTGSYGNLGAGMYGSSGFSEGTFRDLGFKNEHQNGADGSGVYDKKGCGASGGMEKKVGGTELGLPDKLAGQGKITKAEKDALKSVLKKHGGALVPVANMQSNMSAGGKPNNRNAIVKAYKDKHGCSLIEASRKVKELGLYKKK
jgi:hypothetical protein